MASIFGSRMTELFEVIRIRRLLCIRKGTYVASTAGGVTSCLRLRTALRAVGMGLPAVIVLGLEMTVLQMVVI